MSQTRKSNRPGVLHQNRFASARELVGDVLMANLVVARCRTLADRDLVKLVLWIQEISTRKGAFDRHPAFNQFPAWPLPLPPGHQGETGLDLLALEFVFRSGLEATTENIRAASDWMARLCLDPSNEALDTPGKFTKAPAPIATLAAIQDDFSAAPLAGVATTAITAKVWDALDYSLACRGLVLVTGNYRLGKSLSAQAWAASKCGSVRYIQLTSATSDEAFYRQICRSLGVAAALTRNAAELRERVEITLADQRLGLVIDEATYLLPQTVRTYQTPGRLTFLMGLANRNVPVALIASDDFLSIMQSLKRKLPTWSQADFFGRLRLHTQLPESLTEKDLVSVTEILAPEARDEATKLLLAGLAMQANGHLGTLESVISRARFLANRTGRTFDFWLVQEAMGNLDPTFKPIIPPRAPQIVRDASAESPRTLSGPVPLKPRSRSAATG